MSCAPQISRDDAQRLAKEFIQRDHFEVASFLGGSHVSDTVRQAEIGFALGHGDYMLNFTARKIAAESHSLASVPENYIVRVNDQTGECSRFWQL